MHYLDKTTYFKSEIKVCEKDNKNRILQVSTLTAPLSLKNWTILR